LEKIIKGRRLGQPSTKNLATGKPSLLVQNRSLGELTHRGFVFAAVLPEPLLPQKFSQAFAVESSAAAIAYGDSFTGFLCQSFHEIQRDQLNG
jgi:hypothetical protein